MVSRAPQVIKCLNSGLSIPETARRLSISTDAVSAIRRRHSLPHNFPIRRNSRLERRLLNLLIFLRLDPTVPSRLHSQSPARLKALITRTLDPTNPSGWEGTS